MADSNVPLPLLTAHIEATHPSIARLHAEHHQNAMPLQRPQFMGILTAPGVAIVTGAGYSDGWAMAIGIDLGFIALELATLVAPADKRDVVTRYAAPAIVGTLATSAAMNAFAFAAHADGLMIYPAAALGLAIPALISALVKVAAVLWIEN